MAMIEFVRSYADRSTDRGYQFEFHCDHCGNGYMSSYEASLIGTAGGLLQAAGSIFGGLLSNASSSSYEIQRAIGGPAHDRALQQAVAEVKQRFRQCRRCGNWVCAEICWNEPAAQCTACTPKYEQEAIHLRTQAQVQAAQQQMLEKAMSTDYVSEIDMRPDAQVRLAPEGRTPQLVAQPEPSAPTELPVSRTSFLPVSWQTSGAEVHTTPAVTWTPVATIPAPAVSTQCAHCGEPLHGSKFCTGCGAPVSPPVLRTCAACGHTAPPGARFCEDCGGRLS